MNQKQKQQGMKKLEKFVITGKVKKEEETESVQGLKVVAYLAGTKRVLGSAITDSEGNYKIEFENDKPADVNISVCPDVEEKKFELIPKVRHFISKDTWKKKSPYYVETVDITIKKSIFDLWRRICKKYTIFGMVAIGVPDPANPGTYVDYIPIPGATVHIYDVNIPWWPFFPPPPPSPPYYKYEIGTAVTDENGLFLFEFDWCYSLWPWMFFPFPDTKPDILFTVTQTVNDVEVTI